LAFWARQLFWLLFQNLDNFFQSSSSRPVILFRKIFFVKVDRQSVKIAQADIAVSLRFLLLKEKELNCAFFYFNWIVSDPGRRGLPLPA
jgi:hypothetical protein